MNQDAIDNKRQISSDEFTSPRPEPQLVGLKQALEIIFGESKSAPSFRLFSQWKQDGYFPTVKIGRRCFCNVERVRKALEKRFTVEAFN